MIELAQSEGVEVVPLGVPEKALLLGVVEFYEDLADEYQLVFDAQIVSRLLRKSD